MQKNLRGEQSVNVFNFIYEGRGSTEKKVGRLKPQQLPAGFQKEKIVSANIRFDEIGIKNSKEEEKSLNLAVFMNYPSADASTQTDIPQCLGVITKKYDGKETDCMLECTQKVGQVIDPGRPVQLTVVSQNGDIAWNGAFLSIYTDAID